MQFFSGIIIFGILQGLALLVAINRVEHGNKAANRVLSFLVAALTVGMVARLAFFQGFFSKIPHIMLLVDALMFLYGPLLYFYLAQLLGRNSVRSRGKLLCHFLPATIHICTLLPSLFTPKDVYFKLLTQGGIWQYPYDLGLMLPQIAVYLFLGFRYLGKFEFATQEKISFKPRIQYLYKFLALNVICWTAFLYDYLVSISGLLPSLDFLDFNTIWVALSFSCYVLGYLALRQPELFKLLPEINKYGSSRLSEKTVKNLEVRLANLMQIQRPHLNSELTIDDLADLMDLSVKDLSRVVNEKHNMNFYDFINTHRIEEFKRFSQKGFAGRNILAAAFEAGFNSKSSFNLAFKKHTQMTPSQFVKSIDRLN